MALPMAATTTRAFANPNLAVPKPSPSTSIGLRAPSQLTRSGWATSATASHAALAVEVAENGKPVVGLRPDSFGRFGRFGGKYVPETLMYALSELEEAF